MRFFWGFPNSSIDKESTCQCRRPWFNSCIGTIPWRRDRLPTQVFLGFPCGSAVKESTYNAGDLGRSELGRSPGEGKGYPLKYSDLENSTDCIVHGVTESDMTERLSLSFISWCSNKNWSDRLMAHVITT